MSKPTKLTSANLKETLWSTLNDVKAGKTSTERASAVASTSRELMRIVATEIKIATLSGRKPTVNLIG